MIGRRCTHSNVFSRPVLIARNLSFAPRSPDYLSQVIYCGGYIGEDPPLPIPNREVKLTSADGTAPPGGRVGSCRFSKRLASDGCGPFFFEKRTITIEGEAHQTPLIILFFFEQMMLLKLEKRQQAPCKPKHLIISSILLLPSGKLPQAFCVIVSLSGS